ncbi:Type II restriction modification system endonuclease [Mycoplasma yeatsii 13926]|uniref:Type II restriction modification system endonuclease n=1 Tax=Mycoplasma yeatsii 13926 TaxID=1188240 RepID=S6G8Q6_9MOLU|nr:hypothetical protein [Mycoplasma yeatsii]EOA07594.1 Type II restriction modification system endonuclease [Mycoplasma yeatsii 13926]
MKWEQFEEKALEFLKNNFSDPSNFSLEGKSNSNTSDILYKDRINEFYIEVKMPISQSGQFVLNEDKQNKKFIYSDKNRSKLNEFSEEILTYMNSNFNFFSENKKTKAEIALDKQIFYNWIINYYENKNVKFIITLYDSKYIIFPIHKLSSYFDVYAIYREKQSGSRRLSTKNLDDFKKALQENQIKYAFDNMDIKSEQDLDNLIIRSENNRYLLKWKDDRYDIRHLSNTRNSNVIFSLKLFKKLDENMLKEDLKYFKDLLKKIALSNIFGD